MLFRNFALCILLTVLFCEINGENESESEGTGTLRAGEVRMGSYGYKCISDCRKRGYGYYWCDAKHPNKDKHFPGDYFWDYCSKEEGFDYKGTMCYIEHACGNHGYKYKWCYINEDRSEWGYCGYKVRDNET